MNANEYQEAAGRTECNQIRSEQRISDSYNVGVVGTTPLAPQSMIRLNHGAIGIVKEGGEILSILEKVVYYGRDLDIDKVKDELGDVMWYAAEVCNALGLSLQDVLEANIRKLKTRYPSRYQDDLALNRNREAEMAAVVDKMRGDAIEEAISKRRAELTEKQILRGRQVDVDGVLLRADVEAEVVPNTATISIPSAVHPSHEWKQEGRALFCVLCGKYRGFPPVEMSVSGFEFYLCTRSEEGKPEPCCECGQDYPRSDLLRGEVYCKICREEEKVREAKMKTLVETNEQIESLKGVVSYTDTGVQLPTRKRTRADVLRARNTSSGCCTRYADNQSCNCLDTALVGSDVMSAIIPEARCSHCNGQGMVTDEWSTKPTPCPVCYGIMGKHGAD